MIARASAAYYETRGKSAGKAWTYRTRALTPYHARLREANPGATTYRIDPSVPWAFGLYAEVVARSDRKEA